MPPVLTPEESKVDGLAFMGLSLARKSNDGHPDSKTHQTAFDFNELCDRDYQHVFSSNDDGWLVGGGEPGPPTSYKLPALDSAHVEIMRIGTFHPNWGGIRKQDILLAFLSGRILIPEITVVPTAVVANRDTPPELEIRFDMAPSLNNRPTKNGLPELPVNWQLQFLHNQLFRYFEFPSRFCPGAFHCTILRKTEFRSPQAKSLYFAKCRTVIQQWRKAGPKPLIIPPGNGGIGDTIDRVWSSGAVHEDDKNNAYSSGLWLFTDRNTPTHHFEPNFLPPYDTKEKRQIILNVLSEQWDEGEGVWKAAPPLPTPKPRPGTVVRQFQKMHHSIKGMVLPTC